jgi:hypothetical protein
MKTPPASSAWTIGAMQASMPIGRRYGAPVWERSPGIVMLTETESRS